ncbi:atp-dependent dna helicase recg [hydrocarbon metagenome]|uniref:ATP-dependent DNA helicase RecG n=1 Tax=hydrocarbon metagenome TaxID=938273 RepID=A0A0W8G080_9ZZZZ
MKKDISTSVQYIKSVGPKRAQAFNKIGINTVEDLMHYFPTKHLDRTTILNSVKVAQYVINGYEGEVTIIGKVVESELIRYGKKQIFKVKMKDNTGFFECVWFQGIKYFKEIFNTNDIYAVSAKPVMTRYGNLQLIHPDFDKLTAAESEEFLNTGKIIPFYRVSKELKSTNLGDISLRKIITTVVEEYSDQVIETLPPNIIRENNLLPLNIAIKDYHFPKSGESLEKAKERFKYEELFFLECLVALKKTRTKIKKNGIKFNIQSAPIKKFIANLPFELTTAQLKVLTEIRKDMESNEPMNRLLQGDVGSGKTIVALIAMLIAVSNGYQAVLMAPTEILADQHFKKIHNFLEGTGFNTALMLGGQTNKTRKTILKGIAENKINIIVGTHALLEENVEIPHMGFVVIDEQHRFGVAQRSKLIEKTITPDVLIMTATPIPRTVSMTVYGDLDVSIIDEMPKNRKTIKTVLRSEKNLQDIFNFIKERVQKGEQAFIVYPLVEESEKIDLKDVTSEYENIKKTFLDDVRVNLIHGRMTWQEKESIMESFANGDFDVLFSTTVIEVGIDIPNATIIVINEAFRFGLSQLHQLRGRVGRSDKLSYCILVTRDEHLQKMKYKNISLEFLSPTEREKYKSQIRLNAMVEHTDGFKLSEIDFKLRGPGNIFGIEQSGFPQLKHADIITDTDLLIKAKEDAFKIIQHDPSLSQLDSQVIKQQLKKNYYTALKFSHIA